ncbi:MAG: hypothetical protein V4857_02545 [Pseudomonadota bacterium]
MMLAIKLRFVFSLASLVLGAMCAFKPAMAGDVLSPSESQLAKGAELVNALKQVLLLDTINPKSVQRQLGFKMRFDTKSTSLYEGKDMTRLYYIVEKSFPHISACQYGDCYTIAQGFLANNGIHINLPIEREDVCLSSKQLESAFGEAQELSMSSMRHYAPGQTVPDGILPQAVTKIYVGKAGLKLMITFDFNACASRIGVQEDHRPDWISPDETAASWLHLIKGDFEKSCVVDHIKTGTVKVGYNGRRTAQWFMSTCIGDFEYEVTYHPPSEFSTRVSPYEVARVP